ncbi:MAG: signal peptidase I [Candidatus Saccharimonas sp.]|nr:signal peptidase I [Planctomycetaceae bacterium]
MASTLASTNTESASRTAESRPYSGPRFDRDRRGAVRSLVESFISLFVAVLLFRTFAAEGYMISTGSMAPCLLGFHKRVECPTCGATFPFGVAYDTDDVAHAEELARGRTRAVCPNCGQKAIDIAEVPRNHGDQLLVNKQAYLYRSPQRWEIVVFRNPAKATEAYVKRVVGLPGEKIQLSDGDVVIDGQLARKPFDRQRAMRILVHDHDHRPKSDPGFQAHWQPVAAEAIDVSEASKPTGWRAAGGGFVLRQGNERRPDREPFHWVEYLHWIRTGGLHETSVPLAHWPEEVQPSSVPPAGLRFDPKAATLSCTGALPEDIAQRITALTEDGPFRTAIGELYEASHVAPLIDNYGYNPNEGGAVPNPVRDVMLSARVQWESGAGEFAIQLTDGSQNFTVVFDASRREVRLFAGEGEEPAATGGWPTSLDKGAATIEASLFDKQVLVAINGQPLMEPWPFETPSGTPAARSAVRFGARGLDVRVDQLKLYRDVYYTSSRSRHGVNRPHKLGDDDFFMLGDNSPLSHDSRRWDEAPVHRSLLLGKPFLVHLPSKPGRLRVGDHEMHLRLPDMERVRFLK